MDDSGDDDVENVKQRNGRKWLGIGTIRTEMIVKWQNESSQLRK